MIADILPTEIASVLLGELLFGVAFDSLVTYALKHKLLHVSIAVVIGVAITLLIPALAWFRYEMPFYQAGILLVLCFSASGLPMVIGSMSRTVKNHKKRQSLGRSASLIRDEAVMEVNTIINDVTAKAQKKELDVNDLVVFIGKLHSLIGMLKSL